MLGLSGLGIATLAPRAAIAADADKTLAGSLAALEKSSGGKLGVAVLDCGDATLAGYRKDERFTMCSTFKLSLAAFILAKMDAGEIAPGATLPIAKADLLGNSPVVQAAFDKGEKQLAILALAQAAQMQSDNAAANILLLKVGGPAGLTGFWRALGDAVSRLDHNEPGLNTSHDGDPRDTTTPAAMANTLRTILVRPTLLSSSRKTLTGWMEGTQTGARRLRGGLPTGWRAGDKTGSMWGDKTFADKYNDLAIVWRPGRDAPFIVTAFFESPVKGSAAVRPEDEAVLAQAGRIAATWMEGRDA